MNLLNWLREDLLTPRFYTTEIDKAARTPLEGQRAAFEAMLQEMETDYNRHHFDRKAPLERLRAPAVSSYGPCSSPTVGEREAFYRLLGMEPAQFVSEVIRHTNDTARRAFPWVFRLDPNYLILRDQLVETYREVRRSSSPLQKVRLNLRFAGLLMRGGGLMSLARSP